MRKLNAVVAALTLGVFGAAFAADGTAASTTGTTSTADPVTTSLSTTNTGVDTLVISGDGFTALTFSNVAAQGVQLYSNTMVPAGSSVLTYDTQNDAVDGDRSVVVQLAIVSPDNKIPDGVTLTLTPAITAGPGSARPAFTFDKASALNTNVLVTTGITQFTAAGKTTVSYGVTATKGFNDFSGTLTYTIGTGF